MGTERIGESTWSIVPFVPPAVKPPPNPIPPPAKKAQATRWLLAPHFFLDRLSEGSSANAGESWDRPSRYGQDSYANGCHVGNDAKNLEKCLHFVGKRYSCRAPHDFRWLSANQWKSKEDLLCLTAAAITLWTKRTRRPSYAKVPPEYIQSKLF